MRNDTDKLLTLATEALKHFKTATRIDNKERYYKLEDGRPEWVQDMVREAHADMLPDDTRYEFIHEALTAIVDNCGEIDDIELEPDYPTSDLTAWLASRNDRADYVDKAYSEYGLDASNGVISLLGAGQLFEKQEVLNLIVNFLNDLDIETQE